MTAQKLRIILRWVHLVLGLEVMCYVYSPFSRYALFQFITRVIVVPVILVTGIWIWKFSQFNKILRIK